MVFQVKGMKYTRTRKITLLLGSWRSLGVWIRGSVAHEQPQGHWGTFRA